jgi:hypothetical protein
MAQMGSAALLRLDSLNWPGACNSSSKCKQNEQQKPRHWSSCCAQGVAAQ